MTSVAAVFWISLPFVALAFTAGMWIGAAIHVCAPQPKGDQRC
jgi:hypothetical protein